MQTAEFLLSGALGAGFVVSLAVIRIYLGWSYVGNRLLSAAVAYEETGWYEIMHPCLAICFCGMHTVRRSPSVQAAI